MRPGAPHESRRWAFAIALLLVLAIAAGLRVYHLPELPVGLHYDEAAIGVLVAEIARGLKTPIFISSYTGQEVLFHYWAALWSRLLGANLLALRLSAALAGLATVGAGIWAVRELLHGRRDADWTALFTGAFLATSFWHLVLSRYGFRAIMQPLTQALTVAALWRGLRLSSPPPSPSPVQRLRGLLWLLLAGFLCGLTAAYTYLAGRAFPIPLAAALLTLLVVERGRRRMRLGQLALFACAAALTVAPVATYWWTHPGSFLTRTQQVAATSWADVWAGLRACLGMLFLRGDPYIRFNLPYRPLFDPLTAALFLVGVIAVVIGQGAKRKSVNQQISRSASPHSAISNLQSPASNFQPPISNPQPLTSNFQPPISTLPLASSCWPTSSSCCCQAPSPRERSRPATCAPPAFCRSFMSFLLLPSPSLHDKSANRQIGKPASLTLQMGRPLQRAARRSGFPIPHCSLFIVHCSFSSCPS